MEFDAERYAGDLPYQRFQRDLKRWQRLSTEPHARLDRRRPSGFHHPGKKKRRKKGGAYFAT